SSHAVFNPEKLDWFNGQHINRLTAEAIAVHLEERLRTQDWWTDEFLGSRREWLRRVIELLKPRSRTLSDFVDRIPIFLAESVEYDPLAVEKHLKVPHLGAHVRALRLALEQSPGFRAEELERVLREVAESLGVKAGILIHATRVGLTGQAVSPGLFEVMELIGPERTLRRLATLERFLSGAAEPAMEQTVERTDPKL
ncbi:MAG: hypothetical protein ACRD1T_21975, partial [Acidimicrobiia bacterium]